MKRLLLFVLLFVIAPIEVFAAVPDRPTTSEFVFDYQNVIDDEVESEINEIAEMLNEQDKMQLFIVTVPTIGQLEPFEYGVQVIRQWGIGQAETNNGLLIFATTDQGAGKNIVRIATGQGLEGNYPDGKTGRLLDDYMVPHLIEGDYTGAFANVVDAIRLEEGIDYAWAALDVVADDKKEVVEEDLGPWTWKDTVFIIVFLLVVLFILWVLWRILKFIIRVFFGDDDFTNGSGPNNTGSSPYYYDNSSYSSDDSYSGGGGDSAGGGSDRNF